MKKLSIVVFLVLLAGCDPNYHPMYKGSDIRTICVDGVAYLRVGHGISVKLHADGTPYVCVDTDGQVIIR